MRNSVGSRLQTLGDLPSPPHLLTRMLELARDPRSDLQTLAREIGTDPGLAARVLRTANAAHYAQARTVETLPHALSLIGFDPALTMCLGHVIAGAMLALRQGHAEPGQVWRRALLAALAARCVAEVVDPRRAEFMFTAGLLQDLGITVIEQLQPGFYAELAPDASHEARTLYERERLGMDHADVGCALLEHWQLPPALCAAVGASHAPQADATDAAAAMLAKVVALGGDLADALLAGERRSALRATYERAAELLGLNASQVSAVLARVVALNRETSTLFEVPLLSTPELLAVTADATALLITRATLASQDAATLGARVADAEQRARLLLERSQRDPLTGLYNRAHFEHALAAHWAQPREAAPPLAVILIDLDCFKRVNDAHGLQAGDEVLQGVAGMLERSAGEEALVCRYDGAVFTVLLRDVTARAAVAVGQQLLEALRSHAFVISASSSAVAVTASAGLVMQRPELRHDTTDELMAAADAAVHTAKRMGRNRLVVASAVAGAMPAKYA